MREPLYPTMLPCRLCVAILDGLTNTFEDTSRSDSKPMAKACVGEARWFLAPPCFSLTFNKHEATDDDI